jgi:hypothetical protein
MHALPTTESVSQSGGVSPPLWTREEREASLDEIVNAKSAAHGDVDEAPFDLLRGTYVRLV